MLRLPPTEVLWPRNLSEALEALGAPIAPRILGGGTDLLVALKYGHGRGTPLLSLRALALEGIEKVGSDWSIRAATRMADLVRWAPSSSLRAISHAASLVAAPPVQSRATLAGNLCLETRCVFYNQSAFWRSSRPTCRKAGGNVCHVVPGSERCHACHQADLPPVLIALGAEVEVAAGARMRKLPVEDLYTGDGKKPLHLAPGDLLTRVMVPEPPPASGASYQKLRPRRGLDFPSAAAAVYLERSEEGSCSVARVVLGAVDSRPVRVAAAEEALVGTRVGPTDLERAAQVARQAARPVKNVDLTPAYRKQVVGALVVRAAREAWQGAEGKITT